MKTTPRQLAANRRNARLSTGPKTTTGKRSSSRNAHRHGLSTPVTLDGVLPPKYEMFAAGLAQGRENLIVHARLAAEMRYNLDRIGGARLWLISARMAQLGDLPGSRSVDDLEGLALADLVSEFVVLEGYSRRLRSRLRKALVACE